MWVTRNVFMKYRRPADGGDGTGGSGGGGGDGSGNGDGASGNGDGSGDGGTGDQGDGKSGTKSGPTDSEAKLLKEVMEKKNKLKEASEKVSALESKLKEFEGIDVAAVRALLAEKSDAETKQLEAKGEWDRLKAQMNDAHQKTLKAKDDEIAAAKAATSALQSQIAELTVGNSFAQSKFIGDELTLTANKARVVYGQHFEFKEGKIVAFDKPAGSAERTMMVNGEGEPLAFEDALRKLVESDPDKDTLLKSKIKPGAGSTTATKTKGASAAQTLQGRDRIGAALKNMKF